MKTIRLQITIMLIAIVVIIPIMGIKAEAATTLHCPQITALTSQNNMITINWGYTNNPDGTKIEIIDSTNGITYNTVEANHTYTIFNLATGQTVTIILRATSPKANEYNASNWTSPKTITVKGESGDSSSQGEQDYIGIDEQEPNDNKQNANWIKVGNAVYGSSDSSTPDWFKFTAPVSGTAKITMWKDDDYSGVSGGVDAAATVYDSNSNDLVWIYDDFDTDGGTSKTFGVTAGKTYYVRAYGNDLGFYRDGVDYHFKIGYSIGKTTITKVTGKKKAFVVKWNKKSKASFYQVQYIKKNSYTDYGWNRAKKVKVSKNVSSKKITGLKNKKQYYVRVRVARTINGVTYYSGWSPKKTVKTK